jgi:phospholipase C
MADAVKQNSCPPAPSDCRAGVAGYPCTYDASDFPFNYYPSSRDVRMKDLSDFEAALASNSLPAVSFVKALGYKTEHPGYGSKLSAGVAFMADVVAKVAASPAQADTLVLVTFDESGGYFDHVAPPPTSTVDNQPYGARVPTLAVGPFARKNHVSHVVMEHSSIVKFVEWNFLGGATGQLGTRDAKVANLGSLLDPAATGTAVPEN